MNDKAISKEDVQAWVKTEQAKLLNYLFRNNMQLSSIAPSSRFFAKKFILWRVKLKTEQELWVVTGELPSDHLVADNILDERAALNNFSLSWHLKAENILANANNSLVSGFSASQEDYAKLLISWAEQLYALKENDAIWAKGS